MQNIAWISQCALTTVTASPLQVSGSEGTQLLQGHRLASRLLTEGTPRGTPPWAPPRAPPSLLPGSGPSVPHPQLPIRRVLLALLAKGGWMAGSLPRGCSLLPLLPLV